MPENQKIYSESLKKSGEDFVVEKLGEDVVVRLLPSRMAFAIWGTGISEPSETEDSAVLFFNYRLVDNPENIDVPDEEEIIQTLGDVLMTIIIETANRVIDEHRTDNNQESDIQ